MRDLLISSIGMYSKTDLKAVERMLKNADLILAEDGKDGSVPDSRDFILFKGCRTHVKECRFNFS
ncbi:TPA: hypothetical protein TVN87_001241 [Streptococcus equi subsp. zooepidemicus]|nr:hypothetical protein [Streptococcus equi subsp. zooepidemicus]